MNHHIVISRTLQQTNPELFQQVQEKVTPMLEDTSHIPAIMKAVQEQYPELDRTYTYIMFVCCVYDFYCPASFIGRAVQKLPIGIRDTAAQVMGYTNPENVNSWRDQAAVHIKNPRYRAKVDAIKEEFKQFSVRKCDWELKLG